MNNKVTVQHERDDVNYILNDLIYIGKKRKLIKFSRYLNQVVYCDRTWSQYINYWKAIYKGNKNYRKVMEALYQKTNKMLTKEQIERLILKGNDTEKDKEKYLKML